MAYRLKRHGELTPYWVAEVVVDGKRHRKTYPTKRLAEQQEALWRAGVFDRGAAKGPRTLGATVEIAAPHLWPPTANKLFVQCQATYLRRFVLWAGADKPLEEITAIDVEHWTQWLRKERELSGYSVNQHINAVSKLMQWAAKQNLRDPIGPLARAPVGNKMRRWFRSKREYGLFLDTLERQGSHEVADFLRAAVLTGLRRQSLLALRPEDIHDGMLYVAVVKRGKPLALPLLPAVEAILRRRLPWTLTVGKLRHAIEKANLTLGWEKGEDWFSLHGARHTAATWMLEQGVDIRRVQEILGHSKISVTERYTRVTAQSKRDALARLERAAMGAEPVPPTRDSDQSRSFRGVGGD